jgi:hypothetical protein
MNSILRKAAAFVAAALLVAGCAAPGQKLSDQDRSRYKSASIHATVEKAPQAFLLAPSGANIGLMFGAIGGLAASGTIEDSMKAFDAYLAKNAISIEKIVREEVEAALRASGKLALESTPGASVPEIRISVPQYGFGVTHLMSSNVVPVLWVKCDMLDSTGKVLWSANDRMLPSVASPMEAVTWDTMRDDPKRIEQEWRKASKYLAQKIVEEL